MKTFSIATCLTLLALISVVDALCTNPTLQDLCVEDDSWLENGTCCKHPNGVTSIGLDEKYKASNINEKLGLRIALIQEGLARLPGHGASGLSFVRNKFAPYGHTLPHIHPRAVEVFKVLHGTFYVGYFTSKSSADNSGSKLNIIKVLNEGDVFVFPQGLIHFTYNLGNTPALGFSAFNNHNPGVVFVGYDELFQIYHPKSLDDF